MNFILLIPGQNRITTSEAFLECRNELDQVFRSLASLSHMDIKFPRVAELLLRRDVLKHRLQALNAVD